MRFQPSRNYKSNDVVMTPRPLAEAILRHFNPSGRVLDPCCGDGAFLVDGGDWCELSKGRDFFDVDGHWDWIVTNPPWSKIRLFLEKSFSVADNVVFLMTVNHAFTKARVRLMRSKGFGIAEIMFFEMPKEFPPSGFQLGAIHYLKGHAGPTAFTFA